jgi:hypothetical protein
MQLECSLSLASAGIKTGIYTDHPTTVVDNGQDLRLRIVSNQPKCKLLSAIEGLSKVLTGNLGMGKRRLYLDESMLVENYKNASMFAEAFSLQHITSYDRRNQRVL